MTKKTTSALALRDNDNQENELDSTKQQQPGYLTKPITELTWQEAHEWLNDLAQAKNPAIEAAHQGSGTWMDKLFFLVERGQIAKPFETLIKLNETHIDQFVKAKFAWKYRVSIAIAIHNSYELSNMLERVKIKIQRELQIKHVEKLAREKQEREHKKADEWTKMFRRQIAEATGMYPVKPDKN